MRTMLEAAGLPIVLVSLESFPDLSLPEEPGPHFRDNAQAKALYYERATGLAAIGEDSGLIVDALGGEPGVHSARWLGSETPYAQKNLALVERLRTVPEEGRTARYLSAVALARGGRIVFACESTCEGRIAESPRGEGGFGYDPVFFYPPYGRTLAEVTEEEKNAVSHRGRSMRKLVDFLRSERVDDAP